MKRLANRSLEIHLFQQMIESQIPERILLVEGFSGIGKTSLLMAFEASCPEQFLSAWIDLKAAQVSFSYVYSRIQKKLGIHRFYNFNAALAQFFPKSSEADYSSYLGVENRILAALNIQDEDLLSLRLSVLREAFFNDLENLNRSILFVLDSFNAAPASVAEWISGSFLADVADSPHIFAVVAGQTTPKPTGEWLYCSKLVNLGPILEIDAWCEYVEAVGLPFDRGQVDVLVRLLGGRPSEIVQSFESLVRGARA